MKSNITVDEVREQNNKEIERFLSTLRTEDDQTRLDLKNFMEYLCKVNFRNGKDIIWGDFDKGFKQGIFLTILTEIIIVLIFCFYIAFKP